MLAIQPPRWGSRQKELTTVGILSGIGTGKQPWDGMRYVTIFPFIVKLCSINGFTTGTVAACKVTAFFISWYGW